MTDTVFNTRLTDEQLEKIRAWAQYKNSTIQAVTSAAVDEFFNDVKRKGKIDEALQQYRNRDEIEL